MYSFGKHNAFPLRLERLKKHSDARFEARTKRVALWLITTFPASRASSDPHQTSGIHLLIGFPNPKLGSPLRLA